MPSLHLTLQYPLKHPLQEYDFDYEDDEQEEPDVDLENKYYSAKGTGLRHDIDYWRGGLTELSPARKEDDSEAAIQEFQDVVNTEEEKGDW